MSLRTAIEGHREERVIRFALLLCTAVLACGLTSASATMRIVDDHGGQVGKYLQAFATVRSTGERVIIDGDCLSACTMVLGLVPSNQICVTPRARLGFHAASMPTRDSQTPAYGFRSLIPNPLLPRRLDFLEFCDRALTIETTSASLGNRAEQCGSYCE
jgi:hypothetical protein